MLLSVSHVKKSFGDTEVLKDVSFTIEKGEHFSLVGRNGSGKSTLLNIITGSLSPDSGTVTFEKDLTTGYLPQYLDTVMEGSLYSYVLSARDDILKDEEELHRMEHEMKTAEGKGLKDLMERYEALSHIYGIKGGPSYRSEVEGAIIGLGFTRDDFDRDTSTLSGGQKTRLSLARILMGSPGLLILDEPVNHLDLMSIEWLEGFLSSYKGTVLLVAHDRYFLDKVSDHVLSLYDEGGKTYKGNYSDFSAQREQEHITLERILEKQDREIKHQQEVIKKLKQFNREKSVRRAESREKVLEKMDRVEGYSEERIMRPDFFPRLQSGKDVLSVDGISKGFDGTNLYENISFEIKRGERVALLGDNGTGKTTMLSQILSLCERDGSGVKLGTNVEIGYFDQAQRNLSPEKTVMSEVHDVYPSMTELSVRQALAAFLFTGDRILSLIGDLSGGEKARVALTKLMLRRDNFLILDEPTNHLDMESKEALEEALNAFDGTVLFVSHDRYFVNRIATRILELYNGRLIEYLGDYDYYLQKRDGLRKTFAGEGENISGPGKESTSGGKEDWERLKAEKAAGKKLQKQKDETEAKIESTEREIARIDEEFLKPENQTDAAKLEALAKEQEALKEELEGLYSDWEKLF